MERTQKQAEYIDGLRDLVEFLEEHPEAIPPYGKISLEHFTNTKEEMIEKAREIGGHWDKQFGASTWFWLNKQFGPHSVSVNIPRSEVCTQVLTGEVEYVEVPDPDAPKVTISRPITIWDCPPSLLAEVE